jgi:ATP-dependent RNA helicase DDX21
LLLYFVFYRKTLAFGIPGLLRLVELTKKKGTRDPATGRMQRGRSVSMIVLCPTRELARQVSDELSKIAQPLGLLVSLFHGGVSYDPQARDLRQGIDVLVGTPGRVIDHLERGTLNLSECNLVVLDEADEMLNMGFSDDVETILEGVGSDNDAKTQCLLFSATTPPWVKEIGKRYQEDVLAIDSTGDEGGARVAKTVRHLAVQLPPSVDAKRAVLEDIIAVEISKDAQLKKPAVNEDGLPENKIAAAANARKKKSAHAMQQKIFGKTIVFVETKREADELVSGGVFKSLTAQALHGDVGQKQRDATLNAFRAGAFNVLVATDVAARGIDINDVDLVIQMDPPRDDDTYVHRSGRTGRAGKKGISVLLFNHHQSRDIVRIERGLGHGFKFDLVGPPSTEAALHAAAKTSAIACQSIPDETVEYFKKTATEMLANGEDAEDVVARCLAAISRRSNDVQSRSLITGQLGMATVEMTNSQGRPVGPSDVMFTVSKLARMSREDEGLAFECDVGSIKAQDGGSAIFDMSVEDAKRLVQFSAGIDAGGAGFTLLKELEIERNHLFGQPLGGRGGGGRGGGRGYNDYSDRRASGRVSFAGRGGGGHGAGGSRGDGRPSFNGGYRGQGRPHEGRNDGRRQDAGGSGGSRESSWRGRYDSGKRNSNDKNSRSNDGW